MPLDIYAKKIITTDDKMLIENTKIIFLICVFECKYINSKYFFKLLFCTFTLPSLGIVLKINMDIYYFALSVQVLIKISNKISVCSGVKILYKIRVFYKIRINYRINIYSPFRLYAISRVVHNNARFTIFFKITHKNSPL